LVSQNDYKFEKKCWRCKAKHCYGFKVTLKKSENANMERKYFLVFFQNQVEAFEEALHNNYVTQKSLHEHFWEVDI
jgi:hypothetical protein